MSDNQKNLNCGSCNFLSRERVFEERCQDLGRIPESKACNSHQPDVFALAGSSERLKNLEELATMMAPLTNTELQILSSLMSREKYTRNNGFRFREKVYIRIRGASNANYLSNFVVGYVLDATRETIRVIGESGLTTISAINDKNSETVYNVKRFNRMRVEMVENKRYVDPDLTGEQSRLEMKAKFMTVIPLDEAVDTGIIDKKKAKKSTQQDDLTTLAKRLGSGYIAPRSGENRRKDDGRRKDDTTPSKAIRISYAGP